MDVLEQRVNRASVDKTRVDMDTTYLVAYARIQSDKESDIHLQGVYFGGVGETPEQAESIARECVNTVKGGTILPRIVRLDDPNSVMDGLLEAVERFEQVTAYMVEADNTYRRTCRKAKDRKRP